jgi:hypothetical protein
VVKLVSVSDLPQAPMTRCNGYLGHPFKNLRIENEKDPPSLLANTERWVYNQTSSPAYSCSIDDTLM